MEEDEKQKRLARNLDPALEATEPFLDETFQRLFGELGQDGGIGQKILAHALVSAIESAAEKGARFTLSNGLRVTVHRLDGPEMQSTAKQLYNYIYGDVERKLQLLKADAEIQFNPAEYYIVTVKIENVRIRLVYFCPKKSRDLQEILKGQSTYEAEINQAKKLFRILSRLHERVAGGVSWDCLTAIVCNNRIFSKTSRAGGLLLKAVENKTNPNIDTLLT